MTKLIIMNGAGWPGMARSTELLREEAELLTVVEEGIKLTERDPGVRSVGYNSPPNAAGVMQLDASIMDGDTLSAGAVGALEGFMHPSSVAREVMKRLPHVMVVGAGAQQFARECGFPEEEILSPQAKHEYEEWRSRTISGPILSAFSPEERRGSHGTVISLVRNSSGSFAGGVSTSGWDYKYPGRLGDSPIIGAGLYVDSRYGAAACTYCGENAIRVSLARSVILYMKKGASVADAVAEGIADLSALKGGIQGQVVVYATDKDGAFFVGRRFRVPEPSHYLVWNESMASFEKREACEVG
jgi:L-asparaginase